MNYLPAACSALPEGKIYQVFKWISAAYFYGVDLFGDFHTSQFGSNAAADLSAKINAMITGPVSSNSAMFWETP